MLLRQAFMIFLQFSLKVYISGSFVGEGSAVLRVI